MSEFSMVTFKPTTPADQAVFASFEMLEVHLRDLRQEIEEMIANIPTSVPRNLGATTISSITLSGATASRLLATDASKGVVSVSNLSAWVAGGSGISVTNNGDGTITIAYTGSSLSGSGTAGRVTYWSGSSTLTSSADFLFTDSSGAGVATELQVLQPNNSNSASHSIIRIKVAGSSGGDPKLIWDKGGTYFVMGVDISDSGKLKIGATENIGGASTVFMTIDSAFSRIGIGTQTPAAKLHIGEASVGVTADLLIQHTASSGGNGAFLRLDSVSGDPCVILEAGSTDWAMGVDNSISGDPFRIETGNTFLGGGTVLLNLTTAGDLSLKAGNFDVTRSFSGGTVSMVLLNTSNTANSKANLAIQVQGPVAHDPYLTLQIIGGVAASLGIDNSNNDYLVCSYSTSLGTSDIWWADASTFFPQVHVDMASGKVIKVNGTQVLTAQQAGVGADLSSSTAGATYGATEQTMLQDAHDRIRTVLAALKTHGMIAT